MNWQDEGFLISKIKFRENANIINVFTSQHGKISGIVYGGNSRKIKNYLQTSNKIFVVYNSKNENKIGYFKTELVEPYAPKYFNNKLKTSALLSCTSLLTALLPESQPNNIIYKSFNLFLESMSYDNWVVNYIMWELNLIQELGFGIELNKFTNIISSNNNITNVKIDNVSYQIPNVLILNSDIKNFTNETIVKSLIFNRNLMLNKFFTPNNLIFPKTRIIMENYFN